MEQNIKPEIIDKITKVCLCRGISRATIKEAIKKGARTVEEVKEATGATIGGCNGKRCAYKIEELLKEYYSQFEE